MEGTEQPPTWPPRPTVEDEPELGEQVNPNSGTGRDMSDLPNDPAAHNTTPTSSTPVNNDAETTPENPAEPRTPVNAAPADPAADRVQIILKDQSGTSMAFGVKSSTRMEKVMNAYADRSGRPVGTLRFYYDGNRVVPEDTVATLEMENEDIIEVMTEQIGGTSESDDASTRVNKYVAKHQMEDGYDHEISFTVNAVEVGDKLIKEMEFVVVPDVKINAFMDAWAKRAGCAVDEVVFRFNGDKEGHGLPFESEDETFGDIYVSAFADEPTNLVRPREDVNAESKTAKDTIIITVKYFGQDDIPREMRCKMTKTMCFDNFISLYSKRWDIDSSAQHLTFNGKTVFPSDTPVSIGAQDGAMLDVAEDFNVYAMDLTLV
ncbi:unnamed protein product [Aureobasidium mustum]|uniref:Ubiquitin-like domain-containing protein n=1 Tax=Aureobasidium mustum TaxID=2773714 RepID=A0A9N8PLX4_9PEZI|nr:unnamed protein product [Aureobasidium mustum]